MNEPAIELPVDDILAKFEHGDKWIQGSWSGEDNKMCLHQGIRVCQPRKGDAFIIEQVAGAQGWGTVWNDDAGRTFDDVKQTLVEHREIFPFELEAVFGPQWSPIVDLVRSAAALTYEQAESLNAAEGAALNAAWAAAEGAAREAAREAARIAALNAIRSAAWNAAGAAPGAAPVDAAQALVIRDLIGQHGFTQDQYNLLTGPWASVIGPVHPDDEVPS